MTIKSLGIPLPENRENIELPSHVFDRYEINIQAFLYFINGKLIICRSSSPRKYFKNMYANFHNKLKNTREKQNGKTQNTTWYLGHTFSNIFDIL